MTDLYPSTVGGDEDVQQVQIDVLSTDFRWLLESRSKNIQIIFIKKKLNVYPKNFFNAES